MSFLSNVWKGGVATLWSKLSLWLGYLAIGIAITLGCAAIWFYHQNGELHEAVGTLSSTVASQQDTLKQLESNNAQQDKAIGDLTNMRAVDSAVVTGLLQDYKRISATTSDTKTKIRELEKRNEEVRSYLNTPLPASVRRVLNGEPAPASSTDGH
jgi:LysB family phage lysis regulatory protein